MIGTQNYTKISSTAMEFLRRGEKVQEPQVQEAYKYLGSGANLPAIPAVHESPIHRYLSPSAISENVSKEFGKAIDIIG